MGQFQPSDARVTPVQTAQAPVPENAAGRVRLGLTSRDNKTWLADLFHAQPLRVLFPRPEPGDIFQAAIANIAGGMVAGDSHAIDVTVGPEARAMVMGQAAEKNYRSNGPDCAIAIDLTVRDGAWLEWLPQETILFDRARLRRRNRAAVAATGRLLAGDIL